jgi:hypothetical protein
MGARGAVIALELLFVPILLGADSCTGVPSKHHGTVTVEAPEGACWSGAIGDSTKQGCGTESFDVEEDIIVANAQKETPGRWTLTLTLEVDGDTVDTSTTEFGIATVEEEP